MNPKAQIKTLASHVHDIKSSAHQRTTCYIGRVSLVLFRILPRVIVVVKRNYVTQRWEFPTSMTYSLFRHTHWKAPQGKGRGIPGCLRFRLSDRKINQMIKKNNITYSKW